MRELEQMVATRRSIGKTEDANDVAGEMLKTILGDIAVILRHGEAVVSGDIVSIAGFEQDCDFNTGRDFYEADIRLRVGRLLTDEIAVESHVKGRAIVQPVRLSDGG